MRHLTEMEIARLADESPTDEEAAHLAGCGECAAEVECARAQVEALRALPLLNAPPRGWARLSSRLQDEELMGTRGQAPDRSWIRAASAAAIFVAGALTGGAAFGGVLPGTTPPPSADRPAAQAFTTATTPEAAQRVLLESEAAYVAALEQYSRVSGIDLPDDPINRLAALEGIMLTTRAALEEAPADPVINGYLLTATTQRDAILRQISNAAGQRPIGEGDGWY